MIKLDAGGLLCSVLVYACVLYADFALIAHVIVPFVHLGLGIFLSIGKYFYILTIFGLTCHSTRLQVPIYFFLVDFL